MSKIISSFILFHLAIAIFCAQMGPKDIKIPSEYVTDKAFIDMIFKDTKSETTVYASPSGSGSKCTESAPCTLHHAVENKLKKGVRLYLKGGKYDVKSGVSINHSGSANLYIVISSAPNEKAIITSSKDGQVGLFEISGSYIIIENLTFENVKAKNVQGIVFYGGGQHHVIIRNNKFHNLRTTKVDEDHGANGILLMGEKDSGIKQVIIYGNNMTNNVLGYSEALSVAGNCEEIYVLNNYLKNNTNIGIDFYGNAKYCKTPKLDQPRNSVAMYNHVEKSVAHYDACAGLYVDGARDIYLAENTVTHSQYGIEIGSEEKNDDYPVKNIIVKNNKVKDNTQTGIRVGGYKKDKTGVVRKCHIIDNTVSGSPKGVIISKANNIQFEGNTFSSIGDYFFDMEFDYTHTKNIGIRHNVFSGSAKFRLYGTLKISLDKFLSIYSSNKKK